MMMNKSLENVLKALEQDALAFCSESDWAIVVAECEKAGNVRRVSKSAQVILEKAMSRSEAGRFAAQQRWKNHTKQGDGSGGRIPNPPGSSVRGTRSTFKSPQDKIDAEKIMRDGLRDNGLDPKSIDSMLNGTGTNADKRLARTLLGRRGFTPGQIREFVGRDTVETSGGETPKEKYSPVQYQAVRDAIPQLNASDAKKLTQYLADNDLLGGTAGMTPQQMLDKWVPHLDRALGGSEPVTPKTFTSPNPRYAAYVQYARENGQTPMSRTEHEAKYGGPTGPDSETSGERGSGRMRSSAEPRGSGIKDDGTPFDGKFTTPQDTYGMVQTTRTGIKGVDLVNHPAYKGAKYAMELKAATLYQLQGEIVKMHRSSGKKIPESAKPYMDALSSLSSTKDMYGMDSGKSIVAYTISNIKFLGAQGRALKFELSARLKER